MLSVSIRPEPEPVPREKVVQIAEQYREIEALRRQQSGTQAKMIRACVSEIRQPASGPFMTVEQRRKAKQTHDQALLYLEALATMLENESVR